MEETLVVLFIYVTVQQETAIKDLFKHKGWKLENKGHYLPDDLKEQIRQIGTEEIKSEAENNDDDDNDGDNGSMLVILPLELTATEGDTTDEIKNESLTDARQLRRIRRESKQTASKGRRRISSKNVSKKEQNKNVVKEVEHEENGIKTKKILRCKQCDYTTISSSNYLRHIREVHVQVRHKCSHCNKSFKSKHEAKNHEHNAHVSSLKCEKCDKQFTSRGGLLNHFKQVHLKKALYKCDICEATFFYKQHFQGHMNSHSLNKPYTCSTCDKPFIYKSSWKLHEKKCDNEVNYFDTHNPDGSVKEGEKEKCLCDICGDELSSRSSLKTHHKFVHSDEPKSECETCGKTFKGMYSLQRHIMIAHTEAKHVNFPCEICGKVFNQLPILRQHLKRHKQEFSVFCSTCEKGFYSNYKLKEHERTHTGEKPYTCSMCNNFKCSTKTNLLKHLKIHEIGRKTRERKKKKKTEKKAISVKTLQTSQNDLPLINEPDSTTGTSHVINTNYGVNSNINSDGGNMKEEHIYKQHVITSHNQVIPCPMGDMTTNHMPGADMHGNHSSLSDQSNLTNMTSMSMNTDMIQYEHSHYSHTGMIHHGDGNYDPRLHGDGYYGNMHNNSAGQIPQGLNILTVAMNIVNPGPY